MYLLCDCLTFNRFFLPTLSNEPNFLHETPGEKERKGRFFVTWGYSATNRFRMEYYKIIDRATER
jgi:hypothetical protein